MKQSFTIIEIIIVITLIALVASGTLALLNPWQQMNKGYDAQRKKNLDTLRKTLEDWYNDKNCYPKPSEICYNAQLQYAPDEAITCNICGNHSSSPSSSPYLEKFPCDPESPKKNFLYQVDNITCPKWYRVYSKLSNENDQTINDLGCAKDACGLRPYYGYNYGVASPNTDLEKSSLYNCYTNSLTCNACGSSYTICQSQPGCQTYKKFYSSYTNCCEANSICTPYYCTYIITSACIQCGYNGADCLATGKCKPGTIKKSSCP